MRVSQLTGSSSDVVIATKELERSDAAVNADPALIEPANGPHGQWGVRGRLAFLTASRSVRGLAPCLLAVLALGCNPKDSMLDAGPSEGSSGSEVGSASESGEGETGEDETPACLPLDTVHVFDRHPTAVDYDFSSGQLAVSFDNPPQLQLFDPADPLNSETYDLPERPRALSFSPSGDELIVGQSWVLSIIDLESGDQRELEVATNAYNIVHGGNGRAYVPLPNNKFGYVDLETAELTEYDDDIRLPNSPFHGFRHPEIDYVFVAHTDGLARIPLDNHPDLPVISGFRSGDFAVLNDDLSAIYTGSKRYTYFSEPGLNKLVEEPMMRDNDGQLSAVGLKWVAERTDLEEIFGLRDTVYRLFDPVTLVSDEAYTLPQVEIEGVCESSRGRYVFVDPDEPIYWVIARTGGELQGVSWTDPDGPTVLYGLQPHGE